MLWLRALLIRLLNLKTINMELEITTEEMMALMKESHKERTVDTLD